MRASTRSGSPLNRTLQRMINAKMLTSMLLSDISVAVSVEPMELFGSKLHLAADPWISVRFKAITVVVYSAKCGWVAPLLSDCWFHFFVVLLM